MKRAKKINRPFKGIWVPKEIWLDSNLTLHEKMFLIEIEGLDHKDGCFASNKHFSEFFGVSNGRCSQIINSLKDKKYITIKMEMEGKIIKKRIIKRVFNKLKGGIKKIKGGYLENDKDINTIYINTKNNICPTSLNELKTKNKTYQIIANKLANIISTHKKINCNSQIHTWVKPIELLFTKDLKINGTTPAQIKQRVNNALNFYKDNIGGSYIPVIQSGNSFREKFIKLENAMERSTPKQEENKYVPTEEELEYDRRSEEAFMKGK